MWFLMLLLACDADDLSPEAASPSPEAAPAAAEVEPTAAAEGAAIFATHCATCHGPEGRGDGPAAAALRPPPADLSRPRLPAERHPPSRYEIIHTGKPGTAMQGYAGVLSEAELEAISLHVHTLAHGDAHPGHGHGHRRRGGAL